SIAFHVDLAADFRRILRRVRLYGPRNAIISAAERWRLAPHLATSGVPVFVDLLDKLPSGFDQIGATLENPARLQAAGIEVGFTQSGDATHNARKVRQLAGNAVAHGLSWEGGLAGLTRVPAEAFGVGDQVGTIAVGMRADLALWTGDPLDVAHTAEQVWFKGVPIQMRPRQAELRDRYMHVPAPRAEGGLPRAYPQR